MGFCLTLDIKDSPWKTFYCRTFCIDLYCNDQSVLLCGNMPWSSIIYLFTINLISSTPAFFARNCRSGGLPRSLFMVSHKRGCEGRLGVQSYSSLVVYLFSLNLLYFGSINFLLGSLNFRTFGTKYVTDGINIFIKISKLWAGFARGIQIHRSAEKSWNPECVLINAVTTWLKSSDWSKLKNFVDEEPQICKTRKEDLVWSKPIFKRCLLSFCQGTPVI